MKKIKSIILIGFLIIFIYSVSITFSANIYRETKVMEHFISSKEEKELFAYNWGIIDINDINIDAFLLCIRHSPSDAVFTLRITDVENLYKFFTQNTKCDVCVESVGNQLFIDGICINTEKTITDYFGNPQKGISVHIPIDYKRLKANGDEMVITYRYTIYEDENGKYTIEIGSKSNHTEKLKNNKLNISYIKDECYWDDYYLKYIFPKWIKAKIYNTAANFM